MLPSRETQVRFLKFLTVGGLAFVVQFLAGRVFAPLLPPSLAYSCGWACATTVHYLMNRFWALPSDRTDAWKQFRDYLGTAIISLAVGNLCFRLLFSGLGLSFDWANFLSIPPTTLIVFLILNYWVFRKRRAQG